MQNTIRKMLLLSAIAGTATIGCAGDDGEPGPAGEQGPAGADGAPGTDGTDGTDGADGAPGADGADGADGLASLVSTADEPEGDNCANGGVAITYGVDDNADGTLGDDEVDGTTYVCDGAGSEAGECDGRDPLEINGFTDVPEGLYTDYYLDQIIGVDSNLADDATLSMAFVSANGNIMLADNGDETITVTASSTVSSDTNVAVIATDGCSQAVANVTLPSVSSPSTRISMVNISSLSTDDIDTLFVADGGTIEDDVEFTLNTSSEGFRDYRTGDAGIYDVFVFAESDTDRTTPLLTLEDVEIPADTYYVAALHDGSGSPDITIFPVGEDPAEDTARIIAIHTAVGAGEVDVYAMGDPDTLLFENLAEGAVSAPLEAAAGSYFLGVDTDDALPPELYFSATFADEGEHYLFAYDLGDGVKFFHVDYDDDSGEVLESVDPPIGTVVDNNGATSPFSLPTAWIGYVDYEDGDATDSSYRVWTVPGATTLEVTFDVDTESGYDFFQVLDADGTTELLPDLSGDDDPSSVSGTSVETVIVNGNTFTTFVDSDSSSNFYDGYQITAIEIDPAP